MSPSSSNVQDISNVQVGKPYRGSMVRKIDVKTTNLDNGKVKICRTISMSCGIVVTENIVHEQRDVYEDGKLSLDKIKFPDVHADSTVPFDDEKKLRKREVLRQKAREMMKERRQQ